MDTGVSLSDIAAVTKDNDGVFGGAGSGVWIFALLILLMLGGGNGLFGGNSSALSQADLQRAIDLNSIQEGQAGINSNVQRVAYENMAAIKDAQLTNLQEIRDNGALISAGFANQQTCCCETNRNIDSVRYDLANYAAAIQATDTANTQKVLDAMSTNRMADMQNQINQLQLSQAMCGVPKINPYFYGVYPYNTFNMNNI